MNKTSKKIARCSLHARGSVQVYEYTTDSTTTLQVRLAMQAVRAGVDRQCFRGVLCILSLTDVTPCVRPHVLLSQCNEHSEE